MKRNEILFKFFKEHFDSAAFYDGYTELAMDKDGPTLESLIKEIEADQYLKLAVELELIDESWVPELITEVKRFVKERKKK